MPNTQPVQESVIGALRNVAQLLAGYGAQGGCPRCDSREIFERTAVLIRHAIEGLSEPSLAAMQAGEVLLREWSGTPEPQRQLRDTIQGILTAQISGVVPRTWERE